MALGRGTVRAAVPLGRERELRVAAGQARGCSPAVPQPEEQSRSGDSRGRLTVRPAAGDKSPARRWRLRTPRQCLGSGVGSGQHQCAAAWLGQTPRGTAEVKSSSRAKWRDSQPGFPHGAFPHGCSPSSPSQGHGAVPYQSWP